MFPVLQYQYGEARDKFARVSHLLASHFIHTKTPSKVGEFPIKLTSNLHERFWRATSSSSSRRAYMLTALDQKRQDS